jgi:hypothetical protein
VWRQHHRTWDVSCGRTLHQVATFNENIEHHSHQRSRLRQYHLDSRVQLVAPSTRPPTRSLLVPTSHQPDPLPSYMNKCPVPAPCPAPDSPNPFDRPRKHPSTLCGDRADRHRRGTLHVEYESASLAGLESGYHEGVGSGYIQMHMHVSFCYSIRLRWRSRWNWGWGWVGSGRIEPQRLTLERRGIGVG